MFRRITTEKLGCAGAVIGAAFSLLFPLAARAADVEPKSAQPVCATKPPAALLATAADVQSDSFHQFPANRATESTVFKDGATIEIEMTGCAGPANTKMVLTLPAKQAGEKNQQRKTLVAFLSKHQDSFIKTPLGLPKPAMALRESNEGKLALQRGDRICFDKDEPAIVPTAQRCAQTMVVDWSRGAKKSLVFNIVYQAE